MGQDPKLGTNSSCGELVVLLSTRKEKGRETQRARGRPSHGRVVDQVTVQNARKSRGKNR